MDLTDEDWVCPPRYKHPARTKELALQLWGFRCSRSAACVRAALVTLAVDEGLSCVPDERTIREWAKADDWSAEVGRMMRSIAPDLVSGLVVGLIAAAEEVMPWYRDVLAGRVKGESTRMRAALTTFSMIGLPDLAHIAVREAADAQYQAMHGRSLPALPSGVDGQADTSPVDADWKAAIAGKLGLQAHDQDGESS